MISNICEFILWTEEHDALVLVIHLYCLNAIDLQLQFVSHWPKTTFSWIEVKSNSPNLI